MAFIIKPLVTEKMTKITDKSSIEKTYRVKGEDRKKVAEIKYGFIVRPDASKPVSYTHLTLPTNREV